MKFHTLVGQRKCSYPGQYVPEALAVADEYTMSKNQEWLKTEEKKYKDSNEFDAISVIIIYVHDDFVDEALFPPKQPAIDGEVLNSQRLN